MSEADNAPRPTIDRRALMQRAIWLVGGAAAAGMLANCGGGDQKFFSQAQLADLDIIVETMIPETDTPGARAAGVPAFMESMMVNWASSDTQDQFAAIVRAIADRASADHGAKLKNLSAEQQLQSLRAFDAENIHAEGGHYRRFKELVLLGYYHSEIGATQELRYEQVPGVWRADVPFSEIGRAWAL